MWVFRDRGGRLTFAAVFGAVETRLAETHMPPDPLQVAGSIQPAGRNGLEGRLKAAATAGRSA